MKDDLVRWREANPWIIQNIQNSNALCGRYASRDDAIERAKTYRGGVVSIDDAAKVVYVSEIPRL